MRQPENTQNHTWPTRLIAPSLSCSRAPPTHQPLRQYIHIYIHFKSQVSSFFFSQVFNIYFFAFFCFLKAFYFSSSYHLYYITLTSKPVYYIISDFELILFHVVVVVVTPSLFPPAHLRRRRQAYCPERARHGSDWASWLSGATSHRCAMPCCTCTASESCTGTSSQPTSSCVATGLLSLEISDLAGELSNSGIVAHEYPISK